MQINLNPIKHLLKTHDYLEINLSVYHIQFL